MRTLSGTLALLAFVAGGLAAHRAIQPAPVRNVVLVLVDTLRADHLDLYGYERPTAPSLSTFAAGSVVFERAQAQAGCTFPSANSLLTSREPTLFVGRPGRDMSIPPEVPSIAEMLQDQGFATAAVSASPVVRATPNRVNRRGGYGRGFDSFHEECWQQPGRCVNGEAVALLDRLQPPFFLYLHYMEPHGPYRPPPEHRRAFRMPPRAQPFVKNGDALPIIQNLYKGENPGLRLTPADRRGLATAYDEEIRYFDGLFAELLAALGARGRLHDTLIVVAADHGEELLDHGEIGHCRDHAWQTVLATPLIVRAPGVAPRRVPTAVANLDLVPTILDLLGLRAPEGLAGRSLRGHMEGRTPRRPRVVVSAQGRNRVAYDGRWKLVRDLGSGEEALFDLADDPEERRPLGSGGSEGRRLGAALDAWTKRVEAVDAQESVRRANETTKELEAVGYL